MKVLCIETSGGPSVLIRQGMVDLPHEEVYFGEHYTVVEIRPSVKFPGSRRFRLAEKPPYCWYNERYFNPLSNIDERYLVREEYKEKVL